MGLIYHCGGHFDVGYNSYRLGGGRVGSTVTYIGGGLISLVSCSGLFAAGWSIYGVVVFFRAPICPQAEIHLFGKILAWLVVISPAIGCCCGCLLILAGGSIPSSIAA